jgi:transcriptional regulator with XRE-family HTH domain
MPENNPPSGMREVVTRAVRVAMAKHKISCRVLADRIGMPQSAFSRRMTGEVAFTVDELAEIAAALGEPLPALIGDAAPAEAGAA